MDTVLKGKRVTAVLIELAHSYARSIAYHARTAQEGKTLYFAAVAIGMGLKSTR